MREESSPIAPTLTLDDELVRYGDQWSLRLDSVRVIGEYTTAEGPAAEDYFIVFVDDHGESHTAPIAALEPPVTEALRDYFGPLKFGLHWSRQLRSRIMYPQEFSDRPVYTFNVTSPVHPTLGDRLRRLFGTQTIDTRLSSDANDAVAHPPERVRQGPDEDSGDLAGIMYGVARSPLTVQNVHVPANPSTYHPLIARTDTTTQR